MPRSRRSFRTFVVLMVLVLGMSALMPLGASAKPGDNGGPGNSGAAHPCQQDGYLKYLDGNGVVFANTGACVRFAAQGGELPQYSAAELACMDEAIANGIVPAGMNVTTGTEESDVFQQGSGLICGFGGDDVLTNLAPLTGIFLGGAGNDTVQSISAGDFYGGDGHDTVLAFLSGYGPKDSTFVSVEEIRNVS